jgi:hypothetical protein
MGVIGRLDEQVDAVLITPLKRTSAPDAAERAHRNEHAEQVEQPPHAQRERGNAQTDADELPVWLL